MFLQEIATVVEASLEDYEEGLKASDAVKTEWMLVSRPTCVGICHFHLLSTKTVICSITLDLHIRLPFLAISCGVF